MWGQSILAAFFVCALSVAQPSRTVFQPFPLRRQGNEDQQEIRSQARFHDAAATVLPGIMPSARARAASLDIEKDQLKLGFIKLTDMAPLAIAYKKRFFKQANWKVLLDGVITGLLDRAHMLAATIGFGTKVPIVTPHFPPAQFPRFSR